MDKFHSQMQPHLITHTICVQGVHLNGEAFATKYVRINPETFAYLQIVGIGFNRHTVYPTLQDIVKYNINTRITRTRGFAK